MHATRRIFSKTANARPTRPNIAAAVLSHATPQTPTTRAIRADLRPNAFSNVTAATKNPTTVRDAITSATAAAPIARKSKDGLRDRAKTDLASSPNASADIFCKTIRA